MEPREVADAVVLLASPRSSGADGTDGREFAVDGGVLKGPRRPHRTAA